MKKKKQEIKLKWVFLVLISLLFGGVTGLLVRSSLLSDNFDAWKTLEQNIFTNKSAALIETVEGTISAIDGDSLELDENGQTNEYSLPQKGEQVSLKIISPLSLQDRQQLQSYYAWLRQKTDNSSISAPFQYVTLPATDETKTLTTFKIEYQTVHSSELRSGDIIKAVVSSSRENNFFDRLFNLSLGHPSLGSIEAQRNISL
jgi:hypothetical protein